jgi:hypothetical protein
VPHRALDTIMMGLMPPVEAGDTIPDTYPDMNGVDHPVDFDRLVELGVAEKVTARQAKDA